MTEVRQPALPGRRVLVTGGAAGIGRAVVTRFVAEGASVVVLDLSERGLKDLEACLGNEQLRCVEGSVVEPSDHAAAVATARSWLGGLDVLVANAAIFDGNVPLVDLGLAELSRAFDEIFAVNVKGYLLAIRSAVDELRAARGAVIATASFASGAPGGGGVLYTASKHAVAGVVRQMALELAPEVRVNAVAPGVAPTTLGGITALGQRPAPSIMPGTVRVLPLQAMPAVEDYTGLYVLLASATESTMLTGTIIQADSGLSIRGLNSTPTGGAL
jgi:NAD(P)-dependent dehydrogenase (short-subunit alcohol dehydrogenase family)